jgi:hypothetical protein
LSPLAGERSDEIRAAGEVSAHIVVVDCLLAVDARRLHQGVLEQAYELDEWSVRSVDG